jgi:hypothetical protein
MRRAVNLSFAGVLLVMSSSCVHVSSDPIEVKPIHIVADINLRVDRELDDFFAFQEKYQPPATAPATQPATRQVLINPNSPES